MLLLFMLLQVLVAVPVLVAAVAAVAATVCVCVVFVVVVVAAVGAGAASAATVTVTVAVYSLYHEVNKSCTDLVETLISMKYVDRYNKLHSEPMAFQIVHCLWHYLNGILRAYHSHLLKTQWLLQTATHPLSRRSRSSIY